MSQDYIVVMFVVLVLIASVPERVHLHLDSARVIHFGCPYPSSASTFVYLLDYCLIIDLKPHIIHIKAPCFNCLLKLLDIPK